MEIYVKAIKVPYLSNEAGQNDQNMKAAWKFTYTNIND